MRYELSDFEWTQYLESQIGIAAHPSRRPLRGLLRMRSNLLKHNNLMLRSERRERLEAWAARDSPISHSQHQDQYPLRETGKSCLTDSLCSLRRSALNPMAVGPSIRLGPRAL